jgi:hypothetical protein
MKLSDMDATDRSILGVGANGFLRSVTLGGKIFSILAVNSRSVYARCAFRWQSGGEDSTTMLLWSCKHEQTD